MTFSTIMTYLCIAYVLVYAGMIAYDLFLVKDTVDLMPIVEEEEIDISDEAMAFQPTEILKVSREWTASEKAKGTSGNVQTMTGAIEIGTLVPMMEDLSRLGPDSPLGGMIQDWTEHGMAA